ncbi:glucan 1,3-beta-glucosidase [Colletotrichum sojae]|uniref:Glucan 1,3-beta-glucosidase n=1 Tax=Colletotrichum sojae TaxID=2175907 RepID=A0A8H6MZZ6_9PEZI|nr:glucan 1,3-beta-glucosidase [Colletotrichum sojae]
MPKIADIEIRGCIKNVWTWMDDHDNEKFIYSQPNPSSTQIPLFGARGMLIQSEGPSSFSNGGSEHSVLYNYLISDAKSVYMGHIQTESPYYQPNPGPPARFRAAAKFPNDPDFSQCEVAPAVWDDRCNYAWGVQIIDSKDVIIHAAGFWSFYNEYYQVCIPINNCQDRIVKVKGSTGVVIYNLFTVATINMASGTDKTDVPQDDNQRGFTTEVSVWVPLPGSGNVDVVWVGTEVWDTPTGQQPPSSPADGIGFSNVNVTSSGAMPITIFPSVNIPPFVVTLPDGEGSETTRTVPLPPWPQINGGPSFDYTDPATLPPNSDGALPTNTTYFTPISIPIRVPSAMVTTVTFPGSTGLVTFHCPATTSIVFATAPVAVATTCTGSVDLTLNFACPITRVLTFLGPATAVATVDCSLVTAWKTGSTPTTSELPVFTRWPIYGRIVPEEKEIDEPEPDEDSEGVHVPCTAWFFFFCISWGETRVGTFSDERWATMTMGDAYTNSVYAAIESRLAREEASQGGTTLSFTPDPTAGPTCAGESTACGGTVCSGYWCNLTPTGAPPGYHDPKDPSSGGYSELPTSVGPSTTSARPPPSTTSKPATPVTPQTRGLIHCFNEDDFPGHGDLQSGSQDHFSTDFSGLWMKMANGGLIGPGDPAVKLRRTDSHRINYDYSCSWVPGCVTEVDKQSFSFPMGPGLITAYLLDSAPDAYYAAYDDAKKDQKDHLSATLAKIDSVALAAAASRARGGVPCRVPALADGGDEQSRLKAAGEQLGGQNCHLDVVFRDGVVWIVRIRLSDPLLPPAPAQDHVFLSEVATLEFLSRTAVLAPAVHQYELASPENPVGSSYVLMDKVPGRPLNWNKASPEQRNKVLRQLADVFLEIEKHPLPATGSLVPARHPDKVGGFAQEPWFTTAARPSGPFASVEAAYVAVVRQHLRAISDKEIASLPVDNYLAFLYRLSLIPELAASSSSTHGPFYLKHYDDKGDHILIDDEYNITGIIDWEFASAEPKELAFSSPCMTSPVGDFYDGKNNLAEEELELARILEERGREDLSRCVLDGRRWQRFTFFLGGGIPSDKDEFESLFNGLRTCFSDAEDGAPYEDWKKAALVSFADDDGLKRPPGAENVARQLHQEDVFVGRSGFG